MGRGTNVTQLKKKYRTATAGEFPEELTIRLEKEADLRYGENPNQPAASYRFKGCSLAEFTNIRLAKSGKGGLSATNLMDVTRALDILKFFDRPACAVMKHTVPSGFATQFQGNSMDRLYLLARDADARSAFGSIVVMNRFVDKATAEALLSSFVEGVAAPGYEDGVTDIFEAKKDLRVMRFDHLENIPRFTGDDTMGLYDLKVMPTGRVIAQAPYLSSIRTEKDLVLHPLVTKKGTDGEAEETFVVERDPSSKEIEDMLTSWYVNIGVRSNGIVFVKDGVTLAVGSGQQERVGAVEQAIVKAYQKAMDREGMKYDPIEGAVSKGKLRVQPLQGAVMSSDAFLPFRDSIDLIAKEGVSALIQPGGSIRDNEVIQAVNEHKMAMAFTMERCFGHF
jgi:phosphoribosylaminoimidazolecarboxamide formyltransferase/IMP cyclohydrolase